MRAPTPEVLQEHPEGGRFREVFRSPVEVANPQGQARSALTHIYFHLRADEVSRFHRVSADEIWNLYRGALQLHIWDGGHNPPTVITLSNETNTYCFVVPQGTWQAAVPLHGEALVGCSVAPGFDFADFTLIDSEPTLRSILDDFKDLDPRLL